MTSGRISKLRQKIKEAQVDAMLIKKPENLRYLIGFTGSGMLMIDGKHIFLLTDFRHFEQAVQEAYGCEILKVTNSGHDELASLIRKLGLKVIGFESHFLTYKEYIELSELDNILLHPLPQMVEQLRAIKEEGEIVRIARAAKLADQAFSHILPFISLGVTERDVAIELEYFMRKSGAEKAGFDIIVASGARSAIPHARTTDKCLNPGEFVKIDLGAVYEGYHSNMTRTLVLGKASEQQRKIYRLVLQAQKRALDGISLGQTGAQVDGIARDYLSQVGYGSNFGHNLGHGVGLEIHEIPTLGPKSSERLMAGMVTTIEPGIYISGFGGVRIEDLVLLREEGIEILTASAKDLLEL
ncbi:MAG: Xaa-Pro peptidase family protein [Actinomycetota bacterium]